MIGDKTLLSATTLRRNDTLKLIALLTMLVDHIGYLFYPEMMVFRTIGRIAFPIFAYQVAMGYKHTSNLSAYSLRLFGFAIISMVPYAFFSPTMAFDPLTFNIMYLLLMGIGVIKLWDLAMSQMRVFKNTSDWKNALYSLLLMVAWLIVLLLPDWLTMTFNQVSVPFLEGEFALKLSYGSYGLIMMMLFYWFSEKPIQLIVGYTLLSVVMPFTQGIIAYAHVMAVPEGVLTIPKLLSYALQNPSLLLGDIFNLNGGLLQLKGFFFQSRSLLALLIIIALKNRQFAFRMPKYIAYWFYPVHMSVLLILKANPQLLVLLSQ